MCGPLSGNSQALLTELNARLVALEYGHSVELGPVNLSILTQKVRGSLDALVEQLRMERLIPNEQTSTSSTPRVSGARGAGGTPTPENPVEPHGAQAGPSPGVHHEQLHSGVGNHGPERRVSRFSPRGRHRL